MSRNFSPRRSRRQAARPAPRPTARERFVATLAARGVPAAEARALYARMGRLGRTWRAEGSHTSIRDLIARADQVAADVLRRYPAAGAP